MNISYEMANFENNNLMSDISCSKKVLIYHIHLGIDQPELKYNEIMNIFKNILSAANSVWPSSKEWRNKFSKDFNAHFKDLTRAQCLEMMKQVQRADWDKLPWDFSSWLDAIRKRPWKWLGHEKRGNIVSIVLFAESNDAYDVEALEELFIACHCKILRRDWLV